MNIAHTLKEINGMDLINECEWEVIDFSDCQMVVFDNLQYWMMTYDELIAGNGHLSFTLCLN